MIVKKNYKHSRKSLHKQYKDWVNTAIKNLNVMKNLEVTLYNILESSNDKFQDFIDQKLSRSEIQEHLMKCYNQIDSYKDYYYNSFEEMLSDISVVEGCALMEGEVKIKKGSGKIKNVKKK